MPKHDIALLERQIKTLNRKLKQLAEDDQLADLLRRIHGPGWTTEAEHLLVSSILGALERQLDNVVALKTNLLDGSRLIGVETLESV
jgi:hypothetical protein